MEYEVTKCLPRDGERVMCFGHMTHCCSEDMDEKPLWHEVIFRLEFSEYKLKDKVPEDPEESIFEYCHFVEAWEVEDQTYPGYGANEHVIGVTKWKRVGK